MKHLITFLIIAFSISSCGPSITFNDPQPVKNKDLSSFPKKLKGAYYSTSDSTFLLINDHLIIRYFLLDGSIKELSTSTIDAALAQQFKLDSSVLAAHPSVFADTLFNINRGDLLRKFRGYYFLNKKLAPNSWEVQKLHLKKGALELAALSKTDDVEKLAEITDTNEDTVLAKPVTLSQKMFRKLNKEKGFSAKESYTKMVND